MKRLIAVAAGVLGLSLMAVPADAQNLFGASPSTNQYYRIDTATAAAITTQSVTLAGFTVTGINSLTRDPTTGLIYIIAKTGLGRQLAVLDLVTGVATLRGSLGDDFSSLAFSSSGQLYGVTDDGATVPETMYTINKANGARTLFLTLGNGADGEVIAFNPNDGLMYHWSGNGTNIFESINLTTLVITPIAQSGATHGEIFGAVWNPGTNSFYLGDIANRLLSQTTGGVAAILGTAGADNYRGFAIVAVGATATPTLGEWGMILLTGLLLFIGAYKLRHNATA